MTYQESAVTAYTRREIDEAIVSNELIILFITFRNSPPTIAFFAQEKTKRFLLTTHQQSRFSELNNNKYQLGNFQVNSNKLNIIKIWLFIPDGYS